MRSLATPTMVTSSIETSTKRQVVPTPKAVALKSSSRAEDAAATAKRTTRTTKVRTVKASPVVSEEDEAMVIDALPSPTVPKVVIPPQPLVRKRSAPQAPVDAPPVSKLARTSQDPIQRTPSLASSSSRLFPRAPANFVAAPVLDPLVMRLDTLEESMRRNYATLEEAMRRNHEESLHRLAEVRAMYEAQSARKD